MICQQTLLLGIAELRARVGTARLKMNEIQTRDAAKIADVARSDGIAEFERAGSDDEIGHWNSDSFCGLFRADARDDFGGGFGNGMDWNGGFQLIEEQPAALTDLRCARPIDPVSNLGNRNRG